MKKIYIILSFILIPFVLLAQNRPYRVGTTTAAFLEIGYGSAGIAMGDAYVSLAEDISAIYWNPAGLAYMKHSEVQFVMQPWIVDINTSFSGAGLVLPGIGTFAIGLIYTDYGDMDVTTVQEQDGTGEIFSSSDYAMSISYARKITDWFAFGASGKYIGSKIWHMNASALALDVGVRVNTAFFSPTQNREDGMRIAMSISNYGSRMRYDGIDMLFPIDILPDEDGNYQDVSGKFNPNEWELPLIFRLGFALNAMKTSMHRITLALDALHPNNNAESVNLGGEYELNLPTTGKFFLRGGYKALFLPDSEYGLTLGGGFQKFLINNVSLKLDYAYREIGLLGKVHCYTLGFTF
jgi:hypothetical protein